MLRHYDPNVRDAKHVLRVVFQQWGYRAVRHVTIGGNTRGASLIATAVDEAIEQLVSGEGPDGDTLFWLELQRVDDPGDWLIVDQDGPAELRELVTDVQIVNRRTRNA